MSPLHKTSRPELLQGTTHRVTTGCGYMYITVNVDEDNNPFEVFVNIAKAGGCISSLAESLGRMASLILRCGGTTDRIVRQLMGISCHQPAGLGKSKVRSCADGIAKVLSLYLPEDTKVEHHKTYWEEEEQEEQRSQHETPSISKVATKNVDQIGGCPDCGSPSRYVEGCQQCSAGCGWSRCS